VSRVYPECGLVQGQVFAIDCAGVFVMKCLKVVLGLCCFYLSLGHVIGSDDTCLRRLTD